LFGSYRFEIIRIYHRTQQVYTEKEILALAAKAGISSGSIQEVHDGLVEEGRVEKVKISGSNYFFSFEGKKDRMDQIKHQETLKRIEELKPKVAEASANLADAKRGREETVSNESNEEATENVENGGGGESRAKKLVRLADMAKEKVELERELEALKQNDPAAIADL
jgi:DNA-binding transcriptional regulator YhcF (GntR family)